MSAMIVEQGGSYLLIVQRSRFVIIERRNGHLYSCHGGKRLGTATDDLSGGLGLREERVQRHPHVARRAPVHPDPKAWP